MLFSLPSVSKCQNSNWLLSLLFSDKIAQFNPVSLGGEILLEQKNKEIGKKLEKQLSIFQDRNHRILIFRKKSQQDPTSPSLSTVLYDLRIVQRINERQLMSKLPCSRHSGISKLLQIQSVWK